MSAKSTETPSRLLVVEDHAIVRHGMRVLLAGTPDLVVCAEAADVDTAWQQLQQEATDVVVLDLILQDGSGLDLLRRMRAAGQTVPVLVLSMHDETTHAEKAFRAGAQGYVMKEDADEVLVEALRTVLRGDRYISKRLNETWTRHFMEGPAEPAAAATAVDQLTDREQEIFAYLGQGLTSRQIAERGGLSARTVEVHRAHIKRKLGCASAAELLREAVRWVTEREG